MPPHRAASAAERMRLVERSVDVLSALDQFEVVGSESSEDEQEMIRVHLAARGHLTAYSARAKIKTAWKMEIAGSRTSLHVFRDTPAGFELRFVILDQGTFLSGVYEVELPGTAPTVT